MKSNFNKVAGVLVVQIMMVGGTPLIDEDGDGISDIHQIVHGVSSMKLPGDFDGDGEINATESAAGTNPALAGDFFAVSSVEKGRSAEGEAVTRLRFRAVAGKVYQAQESRDLVGRFLNVGLSMQAASTGEMVMEVVRDDAEERLFYQMKVSDVDEDQDGLSAYEEAIVGSSDSDANSSGHAAGDVGFAKDWLKTNDPGFHPEGVQANLKEVDVTWVRIQGSPATGPSGGDFLTVVGTEGYSQITGWRVASPGANPAQLGSVPPLRQHSLRVLFLSPGTSGMQARFLSGGIGAGRFQLSSRSLDAAGSFAFHDGMEFGPGYKGGPGMSRHAWAYEAYLSEFGVGSYQVVTALLATNPDLERELKLVTWRVDASTGELTQLQVSPAIEYPPLAGNPEDWLLQMCRLSHNRYQVTLKVVNDELFHLGVRTNSSGGFVKIGSFARGRDSRRVGPVSADHLSHAVVGVSSEGYVSALREPDGRLKLGVWDAAGIANVASVIAHNELDLKPGIHGVEMAPPVLDDSYGKGAEGDAWFGEALAIGDFDGDGFDDIASGAPRLDIEAAADQNYGAVYIMKGYPDGIYAPGETTTGYFQRWWQGSLGIGGQAEENDLFGSALASGDFNNDGFADLAIGVPGEDIGVIGSAGLVQIIMGSVDGLTAENSLTIVQEDLEMTSEVFDNFGASLTTGDFDGDGFSDLAIGAPGKTVSGQNAAGAVAILWGSSGGVTFKNFRQVHQDVVGFDDEAEEEDRFGFTLAAGDLNGDGRDDLAIGVPFEDVDRVSNAGAVQVLYGSADQSQGFTIDVFVSQNGFAGGEDIEDEAEEDDRFGIALAIGDFNSDGPAELVVGVPNEDDPEHGIDSGLIHVFKGSIFGITWIDSEVITEITHKIGVLSSSDSNEKFGAALATGDLDGDGFPDLVVSAPQEEAFDRDNVGLVAIIKGSEDGLREIREVWFRQDDSLKVDFNDVAINGVSEEGDLFGKTLALGDVNGDGLADLAVGIPFKDLDDETLNVGALYFAPGMTGGANPPINPLVDLEWFPLRRAKVRAIVADLKRERSGEDGSGLIYSWNDLLEERHMASTTKLMTLLLAVEAIEDGDAALDDVVEVKKTASDTGGSLLDYFFTDDSFDPVLTDEGEKIPFIEEGDKMPLLLLIAGMMNESGNRCSVAIAHHIAKAVTGDAKSFLNMMNDRAKELGMEQSLFGHPAGGWVTKPQDLITLLAEYLSHPLALELAGIAEYRTAEYPDAVFCGVDGDGNEKCNGAFRKFNTIGNYPGRISWKGGNGGLWYSGTQFYGTAPRPDGASGLNIPFATSSAGGIVSRMDRTLGISLMETGSRADNSQDLFDHGFQKILTPDLRATRDFPEPGGVVGPEGPIKVTSFALDYIEGGWGVTAVIDEEKDLRVNIWNLDAEAGTITPAGFASRDYGLNVTLDQPLHSQNVAIDVIAPGGKVRGFFTGNLDGEHLDLAIWTFNHDR